MNNGGAASFAGPLKIGDFGVVEVLNGFTLTTNGAAVTLEPGAKATINNSTFVAGAATINGGMVELMGGAMTATAITPSAVGPSNGPLVRSTSECSMAT